MKAQANILVYDGTFEGLLTCIFCVFEQKMEITGIFTEEQVQHHIFSLPEVVVTNIKEYERVKTGLQKIASPTGYKQLYFAFLSELPGIELTILRYAQQAFTQADFSSKDYGDPVVLKIVQTAKMVSREKHRMEAFVRFKLTKDNIYFALIEPDFHVLPLILRHFESRYADQKWIIYDKRRKIGLFYDLTSTVYVQFENYQFSKNSNKKSGIYEENENEYEDLWQNYFNSVNIPSRKNTKLHVQHVPKRYWKYLSEKRPLHK